MTAPLLNSRATNSLTADHFGVKFHLRDFISSPPVQLAPVSARVDPLVRGGPIANMIAD